MAITVGLKRATQNNISGITKADTEEKKKVFKKKGRRCKEQIKLERN